jgi:hypothetical protein
MPRLQPFSQHDARAAGGADLEHNAVASRHVSAAMLTLDVAGGAAEPEQRRQYSKQGVPNVDRDLLNAAICTDRC